MHLGIAGTPKLKLFTTATAAGIKVYIRRESAIKKSCMAYYLVFIFHLRFQSNRKVSTQLRFCHPHYHGLPGF